LFRANQRYPEQGQKNFMANITEEHLHHMARRHHATMQKFDGLREKLSGYARGFFSTAEVGAGSWLGGMIEGRTGGTIPVLNVPINLVVGGLLIAAGHLDFPGGQYSEHLQNLGNGFFGSYVAATGYAFGKRWKESKSLFGGGGHFNPYSEGAPPAVHGELSQEHMQAIARNMQAAAMAGAHQ
jgi:hypothetical protein